MKSRKQAAHLRGLAAERECADFLAAKGYAILGIRVRTVGGEIDIVAQAGDMLVLVEVKARRRADDAMYAVTPAKQRRMARAAEALLAAPEIAGLSNIDTFNMRFDVMAALPGKPPMHLEDAFRP